MGGQFDAYFCSEYIRARETAAYLDIPGAKWNVGASSPHPLLSGSEPSCILIMVTITVVSFTLDLELIDGP